MEREADRLDRLEREVAALAPSLRERLAALESRPAAAPPAWSARLWGLAEKAIVPVLILLLGFVLKDSVEQALKQRQLELSAASQIQGLVQKLASSNRQESRTAAVTLASFGDFAAIALARELQEAGTVGALAAEDGLRALALAGSGEACAVLRRMVRNRTQLYDWRTHRTAIRLLGQLECHDARSDLTSVRQLLAQTKATALSEYSDLVKAEIDADDLRQLKHEVSRALTNLDRASG